MNKPIVVCEDSFQNTWAKAIKALEANHWKVWNVVVQIDHPELFDKAINILLDNFSVEKKILLPKHVAHTIFPQTFYINGISRNKLYAKYWRFYNRPREKQRHDWGTYFLRLTKYSTQSCNVDQLGRIIDNINSREKNYGSSYVMVIPYPHNEINKIMGAPCLNNISLQVEEISGKRIINMLAVYRNHDFFKKAYGNYMGLCNLMKYIANETSSLMGSLTCVSSHAYVDNYKSELAKIANTILGIAP